MAMRAGAAAALLLLGACAQVGTAPPPTRAEVAAALAPAALAEGYNRAFERSFTEAPFEFGSLAVVTTEEDGDLATYNFFPCADGRAICAGSAQGPAGRLLRTPRYTVVEGLHQRVFWLSYGGDGWAERNGTFVPLAWNARVLGTGDGTEPSLEEPAPQGIADPLED